MEENSWSNPINMGFPLNTVDDDLFFTTSVDGARGTMPQTMMEGTVEMTYTW